MWAHIIGDTVRFESLDPPLLTFTGRTKYTLSAFGEHLISEEVEGAVAVASAADRGLGPRLARRARSSTGRWAIISSSSSSSTSPPTCPTFAASLDADLSRRNAHYQWFRADGGGLPLPASS